MFIGKFEEMGTFLQGAATWIGEKDCVCNDVISMDPDPVSGLYATQLMSQGTCLGTQDALIGGSGLYAGASGYYSFAENDDEGIGYLFVYICGLSCTDTCLK